MGSIVSAFLEILRRFLRWWVAELAGLVPERVRSAFAPRSEVIVADASSGAEISITRAAGSRTEELARLPQPGSAPGDVAGAGRLKGLRAETVLRLPPESALRKTIHLPQAAESNLREIVYFELDRQTPFRADEVYFDCAVRERLPNAQRVVVELTVLTRRLVDPVLEWIANWGIEPTRIEGAGADGWTCRLPARDEGGEAGGRPWSKMVNPGLAALALVLAGVAVYVPLMQKETLLRDLQAELAVQKAGAEASLALKEQLAALSEEALHVVNQKREFAPFLEIWHEITRIMPDHSYALELRLRQREVELLGESQAATSLLDLVEASPLFQRASFRSPITRGRNNESERFHLAFEVRQSGPQQQAER